jgi:hypothetical protein
MSDINLDFTVSNNSIDFTVEPNEINITPTDVQLTIFASGAPAAGGSNTQLQYNNQAQLAGSPAITYDSVTNVVTITNTTINNGTINAYSITSESSNLGDVSNVSIGGGVNGYVLQTDGAGNLNWTAQSGGGGGNGTPGGSNTQIQYNDSGTFGGNVGFTFNEITGNVNMPGNLSVAGNIIGSFTSNFANFAGEAFNVNASNITGQVANALVASTVYTNAQPNITSLGTLTSVSVSGNANIGNIGTTTLTASGNVTASNFIGNVTGNITGRANTANTVVNNAQPNITSVGTLTSVSVSGNANIGNIGTGGLITATGNITSNANISATGDVTANRANIANSIAVGGLANGVISVNSPGLGTGLLLYGYDASVRANFITVNDVFATALNDNTRGNITFGGTLKNESLFPNASIALTSGNIRTTGGNVQGNRLISTVAVGTPPLTVTSTTLVANLNVAFSNVANLANNLRDGSNIATVYMNNNGFIQPGSNTYLGFSGARFTNIFATNINASNLQINQAASVAVSTTITHKVPVIVNGVTYYMCLTSTP